VDETIQRGTAFAKTTRPSVRGAVPREALFARLDGADAADGRAVAWIFGPPGAGKTTLAASYVEARGLACVWYQLDADDGDPATFFHYLGHAARKIAGPRARDLPAFTAEQGEDLPSFARRFFRLLFARAKSPLALVLDNYHDVPVDAALHAALEAGLSQMPRDGCLIVTSREEPPAAFARLRAGGWLCVVGGEALRFTPQELAEMARLRGHAVGADAVTALHERTQGWAAGAVLMLEHSRLAGRLAAPPGSAAPQAVFDYLAGEIFDRFEPKAREFLLRIACLPRMTVAVAEALSGEPKGGRLLVNLALNDYFVREVPGDAGRIYQLHPLLRAFLRCRAEQVLPEAIAPAALKRAATLLRDAGQAEDAIAILLESRDWEAVAIGVLGVADAMLAQGRHDTLAAWLEMLPGGLVAADPRLLQLLGAARSRHSPRAARQLFERALEGFHERGDAAGEASACCGIVESVVRELDDATALDHWCEQLAQYVEAAGAALPAGLVARAAEAASAALLVRAPGAVQLDEWLARAEAADPGRPSTARLRATAALARGDHAAAEVLMVAPEHAREAISPAERLARATVAALATLLAGAAQDALGIAEEALAEAEADGAAPQQDWLPPVRIAAALAAGDRDRARALLQALESRGERLRRADRALARYFRGWSAALDGDLATAQREAKAAVASATETGLPWLECLARNAAADLAGAMGDLRGAEAQLRAAAALAEQLRSAPLRLAAAFAAAQVAHASGDAAATHAALRAACAVGRDQGMYLVPGWRPAALGELCAAALNANIERNFVRSLVQASGVVPASPPLRVAHWPWPFRVRTLGGFALMRGEVPVELSGKGPGRPLELLKVLVAMGADNVRADQLADALWPHMEADYAHKSFTATLHRLRRMLEDDSALLLRDGRLTLNRTRVWLDTRALERVMDDADAPLRDPDAATSRETLAAVTEEALALYRGPFLPDESEQPAYIACRENVRARLLRFLGRIARYWEEHGAPRVALDCYLRCTQADDTCEPLYRQLMLAYQRHGDVAEAIATYERLRTVLAARTKCIPSPETQALYASLRGNGNGNGSGNGEVA
jgi:ATP/maltotriose-dependent transcriptional regulator MalT/DNA-binding SARP family transcriptional activator